LRHTAFSSESVRDEFGHTRSPFLIIFSGIGGEYPAGSVGCAESTGELKEGTRNKWFILFTNVQIDLAFFISAIVATVVVLITGENHLRVAWRVCLGLGVIPPLSLMYLRLKLQEPEAFKRESLSNTKTPWLLIIKFYWFRLSIVSIIWFIYDFSAYSFGIYATSILANLLGESAPLWKSLAWNILINFFYMPGCLAGAFVADMPSMGPKKTLAIGVFLQGIIGFIMAGCYPYLNKPENVAGFVVVYGIFLALGEFGPGDNIGLIASKTCATGIRYILSSFSQNSRLLTRTQRTILRHRSRRWQNRRLRRLLRPRFHPKGCG
jgi:hypothetical protein